MLGRICALAVRCCLGGSSSSGDGGSSSSSVLVDDHVISNRVVPRIAEAMAARTDGLELDCLKVKKRMCLPGCTGDARIMITAVLITSSQYTSKPLLPNPHPLTCAHRLCRSCCPASPAARRQHRGSFGAGLCAQHNSTPVLLTIHQQHRKTVS